MIVIVGASHRSSPLALREAIAFPRERLEEALALACQQPNVAEAMILSTCNRVEVYARTREEGAEPALVSFLCSFHGRDRDELAPFLYCLTGPHAVKHAFRVAASLDSMVIGEPQILGQVKEAYQVAEEAGTLGPTLGALRNRSLAAAKKARTETGIGRNAVSVSYVAVELARKIFGDLNDRSFVLVGTGKMSELAARHLVRSGARATVVGVRTLDRAENLAAVLGGRAVPLSALGEELTVADIVVSGTGAPGLVIRHEDVEQARRRARHGKPLFLIDIAVPRDIEPSVARLPGVFLYDMDALRVVAEANLRERRKEAIAAEAVLEREVRDFLDWEMSLDAVPLLVELRKRADEIRRGELERAKGRLGLTQEQEEALDAATSAIVNKILHPPTVYLKEIAKNGLASEHLGLVRKLLGL
jgi:glutamyl-tRNA reductase